MTDKILTEKSGEIARIIFNQPEKRNAVSLEMWEAVEAARDPGSRLTTACASSSCRARAARPSSRARMCRNSKASARQPRPWPITTPPRNASTT